METHEKNTWIILIRGINVGGNNIVPMKDLREQLSAVGYSNVRTYIQSGNVVLEAAKTDNPQICDTVANCINAEFGFTPKIMALSAEVFQKIITGNPYPDAVKTPKFLHIHFLAEPALNADVPTLNALKTDTESFHITDEAVYLYLPDGVWKSKLAARMEKCLGVAATERNWRSANKILELAQK